jgi:hypothetical protein
MVGKIFERSREGQKTIGIRMKKLFITCAFAAAAVSMLGALTSANAFEIIVVKSEDKKPSIVSLNGSFGDGDFAKFQDATKDLSPGTTVRLHSVGGDLDQVIMIGKMIHERKFVTIAGSLCMSGCAFTWLAGAELFAYDDSHIGFHGAYLRDTGQISRTGNANLSSYLGTLGYSNEAIIYMTKGLPNVFDWLSFDKAQQLGIRVQRREGTLLWTTNYFWFRYSCPMSARGRQRSEFSRTKSVLKVFALSLDDDEFSQDKEKDNCGNERPRAIFGAPFGPPTT